MIKYVYFKWTQVWTGSFWLLTLKDQHGDLWKFWDLPWWPLTLSEATVEFPQHEASQTGIFFSPPHVERKWNSAPQVTHKERSLCGLLHTALLGVGLWLLSDTNIIQEKKVSVLHLKNLLCVYCPRLFLLVVFTMYFQHYWVNNTPLKLFVCC